VVGSVDISGHERSSYSSARLRLSAPSVLKYQAIFFLFFLDHVYLYINIILQLLGSSVFDGIKDEKYVKYFSGKI
jgi:hypothetical protein